MGALTLRFPLTGDWLDLTQADAESNARAWAERSVGKLVRVHGGAPAEAEAGLSVEYLERVATHYLGVGGIGCLLLVPEATLPVQAIVRLEVFHGPDTPEEFHSQCELMIPPLSWLVDPVDVRGETSEAGPVTRVHVRSAEPGGGPAPVRDTIYWSWWFADVPQTFLASVVFFDITDTARWLDVVEHVVLSARRVDGPPATDARVPEGQYPGSGG